MTLDALSALLIVRRTPMRAHTQLMELFILCGAVYFLWEAARGFGWP
jgi:hypothetical protein